MFGRSDVRRKGLNFYDAIQPIFIENWSKNWQKCAISIDNHLTCIKAITVFVKVICMNIFYMIFIILLSYIMSLFVRDSLTLLLILLCMTIGCAYLPNILSVIKPFSHLFPFIYVNALLVIDGSLTKTFMNPNMYFNFGMMVLITGMIVLIVLIIVLLALETKNDKEKLCQWIHSTYKIVRSQRK